MIATFIQPVLSTVEGVGDARVLGSGNFAMRRRRVTISGRLSDDAKPYQIRAVRAEIREATE
jgi:hypothetical protein